MRVFISSCLVLGAALASTVYADVKSEIESLTDGQHTRIAWLQGGKRIDGGGALMGYDSRTNQVTQILPAAGGQYRPLICDGGNKVVVTIGYKVHIVNWDGSGKRFIVDGNGSDVWVEPQTGKEWVFVRSGGRSQGGSVSRFLLDDPSQSVMVWNKGNVGIDYMSWWAVSQDGTMAVDFLPWWYAYVIDNGGLTLNGPTTQTGEGCWSSVAPDNSYYWMHLGPNHSHITVWKYKSKVQEIRLSAPVPSGTKSDEFYHPKLASKGARFMVFTGGYYGNSDSPSAEAYIARLAPDYRSVDQYVRITYAGAPNYCPDAWVGVGPNGPSIGLSPGKLDFSMSLGGQTPAAQKITITNNGGGSLPALTASSDAAWLSATLSRTGENSWDAVNSIVNVDALASGVHQAAVTISGEGVSPASYEITLTITAPPVLASIGVVPNDIFIEPGKTQPFSASGKDQFNNSFTLSATQWTVSGGGTIDAATGLFTAGLQTGGPFTVTARSDAVEGIASFRVAVAPDVDIKINCGGPAEGVWVSDAAYVQGGQSAIRADLSVTGTDNPVIYRSERYGEPVYTFSVPNATYTVKLHFCEGYDQITAAGARVFDATVEGTVIENIDIYKESGGRGIALVKSVQAVVTDGELNITFGSRVQNPLINGIEIIGGGSSQEPIRLGSLQGNAFSVGQSLTITWTAAESVLGVTIEVSVDGGDNYTSILTGNAISRNDEVWGAYTWIIPESIREISMLSTNVRLRVADYFDGATMAESDIFTIAASNMTPQFPGAAQYAAMNGLPTIHSVDGRLSAVSVPSEGYHVVRSYSLQGACCAVRTGTGPATYRFDNMLRAHGAYCIQVIIGQRTHYLKFIQMP